ncbi:MAG: Adenosine kinase [Candidatus Pacebacteria bacterium GW2011_GWB1_47_8]|nr:MAG: Adenosine kinase [Candidatus Pacebacteria bacterium GW2011_GWA1_46_10]KKU84562.1 MAG: Adenosine kinase [Candidatus Pacebacteria bacterium GW2011_GWB1_47_8]HCR81656.1 carbohydrate kinase family protein [Candidatus Paceibacterota bacterium]
MSRPQLILAGSIAIDRIMNFKGKYRDLIQPEKVHVLSISVLVDKLQHSHGGTGANIAYNLALLGEQPILLSAVGPEAGDYLKKLQQLGVDVSHVYISTLPTASFSTLTDSEDNQVGGFYPGAMSDSATLSLIPWKNQAVLAVISAHDPSAMRQQVEECTQNSIRYVYDVGQQVATLPKEDLLTGIQGAELLFANDYELGLISQKINQPEFTLMSAVPICVTTLGGKGCRITGQKVPETLNVPAVPGVKVIDPTGAGDAFRAGFLFGYVRDLPLEKCAKLGSVVASFAITEHGTQEHSFTLKDCQTKYNQVYKEKLEL